MALPPEHRKSLMYGSLVTLVGLVLVGLGLYVLGPMGTTGAALGAGVVTLLGITALLLAVFLFFLPPFLPAR